MDVLACVRVVFLSGSDIFNIVIKPEIWHAITPGSTHNLSLKCLVPSTENGSYKIVRYKQKPKETRQLLEENKGITGIPKFNKNKRLPT